jgi:hypothetical protein
MHGAVYRGSPGSGFDVFTNSSLIKDDVGGLSPVDDNE